MKNKKSKYKSLKINNKRYYFYKIVWVDIVGDAGHAEYPAHVHLGQLELQDRLLLGVQRCTATG